MTNTVTFTVQGHTDTIAVDDLHANSLAAVIEYGLRRKVQDNINSVAAATRKDGGEFTAKDAKVLADQIIESMKDGTLGVRTGGGGVSTLQREMYLVAKADLFARVKTEKGADAVKALRAKTDAEIRATLDAIIATDAPGYEERATASLAAKAEAAKAKAQAIAKAMSAVAKAELDLDALLG